MTEKITIELDAELKDAAEKLYKRMHLTLEEAIPLLVKYNVEQDTKPFNIPEEESEPEGTSAYGALAKYANPAMIPFEDGAWERAAVKRYVKSLG